MKFIAAITLAAAIAAPACAQHATWIDFKGNALPQTAALRSLDGLGGQLMATTDANWRERWNTPPDTIPVFKIADKPLALGEQVFILIFFANPQLSADGIADLTCDLDVTKPDGSSSVHLTDTECHHGTLLGKPGNLYIAAPEIRFLHEAGDQSGTWTVRVALKDNVRKTVLPLQTTFALE